MPYGAAPVKEMGNKRGRYARRATYYVVILYTKNQDRENLTSRYEFQGNVRKQIDYFTISKHHRNWVTNINNAKQANARQNMQREMIIIKIRVKLKQKIHGNGNEPKYNLGA